MPALNSTVTIMQVPMDFHMYQKFESTVIKDSGFLRCQWSSSIPNTQWELGILCSRVPNV